MVSNRKKLIIYIESILQNMAIIKAFPPRVDESWESWIERIKVERQKLDGDLV